MAFGRAGAWARWLAPQVGGPAGWLPCWAAHTAPHSSGGALWPAVLAGLRAAVLAWCPQFQQRRLCPPPPQGSAHRRLGCCSAAANARACPCRGPAPLAQSSLASWPSLGCSPAYSSPVLRHNLTAPPPLRSASNSPTGLLQCSSSPTWRCCGALWASAASRSGTCPSCGPWWRPLRVRRAGRCPKCTCGCFLNQGAPVHAQVRRWVRMRKCGGWLRMRGVGCVCVRRWVRMHLC